jgi:hypothetical protein
MQNVAKLNWPDLATRQGICRLGSGACKATGTDRKLIGVRNQDVGPTEVKVTLTAMRHWLQKNHSLFDS